MNAQFKSRSRRALVLGLLFISSCILSAAPLDDYTFVHRNGPGEWAAAGDFNGDGLIDAVIVDRVTGTYRIGYQSAGGAHTWIAPRASGIADVAGFSVGHLFNNVAHGLAFTAPAANRVNVAAADNPSQAGVPVSVFMASVGPNQVIALDVGDAGGGGNTPLHDLIVPTAWNGVPPYRTTTVRNTDGASFAPIQETAVTARWERGNRVLFRDGSASVLAVLARGTNDTLRLISYLGGPAETFLQFTNLAGGSDYAAGRFAGTGLAHFLTYRPGRSNVWAHPVLEPMPGTFEPGLPTEFLFPGGVESLITLPASGDVAMKILAILDGGSRAAVFAFDGTNPPSLVQEFLPPEGETLLGATPLENGGVRIHAGTDGRTSRSLQYSFDAVAGNFALTHNDALPPVSNLSGLANVFQFQFEPFVTTTPRLLNSTHAGDWSSLFTLIGGPPQVGVTTETYVDATTGLDNPSSTSLGSSHPLAQFGLANQYAEAISLFSLAPGAGNEVCEVSAQPPGGLFARSVAVSFVVGSPGFQALYRLNPAGAWQTYVGKPLLIFTNTTLQYRARSLLGISQSAIRSETYLFRDSPGELDSDSDGVPDYVEIANNLDPVGSGSDADDDGYSDLEELLKNTSPSNGASHPVASGFEQHASVDWVLTPRPIDGTTGTEAGVKPGAHVRVLDLSGSHIGLGVVNDPPSSSATAFKVVVDPRHSLLLAATDLHYDIITPSADGRLGRELVALLPCPDVPPIQINYTYGGGAGVLNAEAQNWVVAAQAAYHQATHEVRFQTMTVPHTTVAVLFEEKLRSILAAASSDRTNFTLFSFRAADAGRQVLDEKARALIAHGDATRPAYDLKQMLHSIETLAIAAPSAQVQSLQAVAQEIYRVSSASNNAAPGQFRPPLDVLRDLVRDGVLHSNYLATGLFPAPQLADAIAGAQSLLASIDSRPVTNLNLRIRPDTLAGPCTTLETVDIAAAPVNLFALGGGAFDFPDTFELLPGAVVQVVGRPDLTSATCAGLNVEVLSISLQAIPARSDGDSNGNLLIDSWEYLFLGGLGNDPFGDDDGDGYTNLQEMMEGTDPRDGLGQPGVPVAAMEIPALDIKPSAGGGLALEWFWPEPYLSKVQFQIISTPDLNLAPTTKPITPVHLGGGVHRVIVPNPGDTQFFKVVLLLRF